MASDVTHDARVDEWVGDDPLRARARDWVDRVDAATGLAGGWRLQVLSLRTRRDYRWTADGWTPSDGSPETPPASDLVASDGSPVHAAGSVPRECSELPARVRRFVSGCPWPILDQVVRYLYLVAPYRGIVFNGVRSDGVYRPTLTQWLRDAQTQTGGDATYTLVQDLVEVTACRDEVVETTGESCVQLETTTFRWDEPSVDPGEPLGCPVQGVTRSVQAVRRNDDATFDYQLVEARARTRHVPAHAVQCDAAHEAYEERWENLYGEPGSFRAEGACGDVPLDGLPPESCEASPEPGVRVSWEVQLNRDCTYSVSRRAVRVREQSSEWEDGAGCRVVSHVETRGAASAPDVPEVAPGRRVDARVSVEDDGSWTSSVSVSEAPESDSVEWADGSACRPRRVRRVMDLRSKADALAEVPVPGPGEAVDAQVARNEDCTWDVTVSVREAVGDATEWDDGTCAQARHVVSYTSAATMPQVPAPAPSTRPSRGRTTTARTRAAWP